MMPIYLMELRRSPLRWWLPLLIALDLAVLFGRSLWWIGVWPEASVAAQVPAFYIGPMLAVSAAWSAGRIHRQGMADQLAVSARVQWKREIPQLAATTTYGLVAYAAGILAAALVSFRDGGAGFIWPGYLLLGASVLLLCASAGHLAGRLFPSAFAGPVICGLACFVFLGAVGGPSDLGFVLLSGEPDVTAAPAAIASRLAFACTAALAAVTVSRADWRRALDAYHSTRTKAASVMCVTVFVALGTMLPATGPVQVKRASHPVPMCTQARPTICLWPENRKYLAQFESMAERLSALPADLIKTPPAFYEQGLRASDEDFSIHDGSIWDAANSMAILTVNASSPAYCPAVDPAAEERRITAEFELDSWVTARITGSGQPADIHGGPPGVDQRAIAALLKLTEEQQKSWANERLRIVKETRCA